MFKKKPQEIPTKNISREKKFIFAMGINEKGAETNN